MNPFSFIHAADLHLGSPFKGVGSRLPSAAGALHSATFDAFSRLVDLCLAEKVDFLLVSGDVFDSADRSLRAQLSFRNGLSRLSEAGIRAFVAFGNHDPLEAWSTRISFPETVHLFSADKVETVLVSVDGTPAAAVSGISFRNREEPRPLAGLYRAEHPDLYQIGLLHCNCGGQSDHGAYAPCSVEDLKQSGFDYWALGHVHQRKILGTSPHIVYPGCIQGLSIREAGAHGCYQVSVAEDRSTVLSFHPLDRLRWQSADISVSGLETLDDLDRVMAGTLDKMRETADGRPVVSRVRLAGRGPLYGLLKQPAAAEDLLDHLRRFGEQQSPPVWIEHLGIECLPDVDLSRRGAMDDLLGQLLRNVSEISAVRGSLPERLMPVLKDLYAHPGLGRSLETIPPDDLDRLLQDATLICYDLLEPEP